ncbi:hypothetical protein PJF56_13630 [Roseofilum sp. BLCC_M91]|uniref:Uncharacterized protein n=1 Tax=Roseofilum halophilum BLCC-M91 TaxID=3022259 RepID=A0ABT7BL38_9CYAN|nr:hypothetical protein [Roseofilum halophilum]MDJ1179907.1 hypothetical protein [Roseofilum halophilum BLCC-M91]
MNDEFEFSDASSNEEILDLLYELLQDYGNKANQEAVYLEVNGDVFIVPIAPS